MAATFSPGDTLGRYELVSVIGGGGFASVWRARTAGPGGFERDVAVKVMRPARAGQKRFQDMLLDEARLVARIQHPNVAQIWEVGEDPRSLYVVMELVDGDSLDDLRFRAEEAGKSLSIRALFRVLADVCAGLHAAHELEQDGASLGLVHRDVSPQNILVSRHGNAKLIDFGIAKAKERLAADTTTGYIKGKIAFMAPEQARTEADIDRRADVWAIGATAYELITGKAPCEGATDVGRLASLVGPSPVPELPERVPGPLRSVIARSLEKDRAARYPSALALKEAIEEALIESELETSATDVATLFGPLFHGASATDARTTRESRGDSIERAVSSTIEASAPTGTIELPLNRARYWPAAIAALLVLAPLGYWALSRSTPSSEATPAGSVAGSAATPATEAPVVSPEPSASPSASERPATTSAEPPGASAAPDVQPPPPVKKPPTAGAAPRPAPATKPTTNPVIDENAIE